MKKYISLQESHDQLPKQENSLQHNMVEFVSPQGVEQSVMDFEGNPPTCYVKCLVRNPSRLPCVSRDGPHWHVMSYSGSFKYMTPCR
jgi:hypothetical protein